MFRPALPRHSLESPRPDRGRERSYRAGSGGWRAQRRLGTRHHSRSPNRVQPLWAPLLQPGPPRCLPFSTLLCFSQARLKPTGAVQGGLFPAAGPTGTEACVGEQRHGPPQFWRPCPQQHRAGRALLVGTGHSKRQATGCLTQQRVLGRDKPHPRRARHQPTLGGLRHAPYLLRAGWGTCGFPPHPQERTGSQSAPAARALTLHQAGNVDSLTKSRPRFAL